MTQPALLSTVNYVEGFEPGYLGRLVQMHAEYYAKAWGAGAKYEAQTAQEAAEFCEHYDPEKDLLFTAHIGGRIVGTIAIVGTQTERPGEARLRWFLLEEDCHGQGIGSHLLEHALDFCRTQGFPRVYLWTVEGLPGAFHLYEKAGFQVVERFVDARYTVERRHMRMEKRLDT